MPTKIKLDPLYFPSKPKVQEEKPVEKPQVVVTTEAFEEAVSQKITTAMDELYDRFCSLTEEDETEYNMQPGEWEFEIERDPVTLLMTKIKARKISE
jgi:TPP-dependent pyruvate/acetoin dehydrogenase alpha subunit